jgi:hypothetical protein
LCLGRNTVSCSSIIVDITVVTFLLGDMTLSKVIDEKEAYLKILLTAGGMGI